MTKGKLNLSIDVDLLELAKNSDLNLSQEFEEWVKVRLNQPISDEFEEIDLDKEKARLMLEMRKLESKAELQKRQEEKEDLKLKTIDHAIDNSLKHMKPEEIPESRKDGVVYLFKSRHRTEINPLEAKELIENRMKERGLL